MLPLFGATVFVVGFLDSVVFETLFVFDLLLSPGLSGFAVFEAAPLDSLSFPFSFPCLEEVCVELVGVGVTDFLLLFICLQYSTEYKTLILILDVILFLICTFLF